MTKQERWLEFCRKERKRATKERWFEVQPSFNPKRKTVFLFLKPPPPLQKLPGLWITRRQVKQLRDALTKVLGE